MYRNVCITKVKVLVTEKSMHKVIGTREFNDYPILEGENTNWVDSIKPNNAYLKGLGGDFDGDMVSIKGLYTQEANEEAEKLIHKKASLLDASGGASRTVNNEAVISLYTFTK
jgi:hypothetical protein